MAKGAEMQLGQRYKIGITVLGAVLLATWHWPQALVGGILLASGVGMLMGWLPKGR